MPGRTREQTELQNNKQCRIKTGVIYKVEAGAGDVDGLDEVAGLEPEAV